MKNGLSLNPHNLNFVEDIRGEIEAVVGMNLDRHFEFFMMPDPLIKVTYMVYLHGLKNKETHLQRKRLGNELDEVPPNFGMCKVYSKAVPS